MTVPWYEEKNIKNELMIFGRAIQGVSPYKVVIEPNPAKCHNAYCSFSSQKISVNPTAFSVSSTEQYQLTKALLVHEAGHRRHTIPTMLPTIIHEIANILEDERVERRMWEEFVGIRWLINKLAVKFYEESTSINCKSDISDEVISYFLQLRWAKRTNQPVKGELSTKCQILWKKVEPLVYESWEAENSITVDRNAAKIANILNIKKHK